MAAADTNETAFVRSYEKLTGDILKNFKEDRDALLIMQTSDRALQTQLWLRLLNQIGRTRDVNFDPQAPENRYYGNFPPPLNPSDPKTFWWDSGPDAASVKEPDKRRPFEQALRENHERALRSLFEHRMKTLEESCTSGALVYLNSAYAKTPGDARELIASLGTITDAKRRAGLEAKLSDFTKLIKSSQ